MEAEAVLVIPSPERGRDFVLPLSLGGVRVRAVVQSGNQLLAEVGREPVDCILLPETLPDGPAEMWLARVTAVTARRPLAVVLIFGVQASETIREQVRAVYGPAVEVVAAGARSVQDVAVETVRVLNRLAQAVSEQDRDAFERLRQEVAPGAVPQPVRKGGAVAFVGASGGVGTSTLVANLALYAAMAGQRVLIVDAQFGTAGSILHFFGTEADENNHGIHHLRWSYMGAGGAVREGSGEEILERLAEVRVRRVRHAEIRVLTVPAILDALTNLPAEQVTWATAALERLFDLVVMDCGSGLGQPRTQQLLQQAARICLLTGGWGVSVYNLARCLSAMEEKAEAERTFLLLREAGEGAYGARTVSSVVRMPIYGRIPEEPLLRKAESRLGAATPLVAEAPDSPYGKSIAQLAFALGWTDATVEQAGAGRPTRGLRRFRLGLGRG